MSRPEGLHWKDWLRMAVLPLWARIRHALGTPWVDLARKYGHEGTLAHAASLDIHYSGERAERSLDIVFLTMNGQFALREAVFGLALRARGHRVRFVLCDQALPLCEVKRVGAEEKWQSSCARCFARGSTTLDALGFEVLPASTLSGAPVKYDARWDTIVESSLLKHFRVGTLDGVERLDERAAALRRAAMISAGIGRTLVAMRPDRVIMSHGIYTTWGPQFELLREAGIPVMVQAFGKKKATMTFNWDHTGWYLDDSWDRLKDRPLREEEERQLDDYLESRRSHSQDAAIYNFGAPEPARTLKERLRLDPDRPVYSLFTNVLWDAASAQKEIVFRNSIEWVCETVRWFGDHPEKQLVVKIHPSEVVIGTKQSFVDVLKAAFGQLPPNVRVIEPQEVINSWSVVAITDIGIVHTSTIGMELGLEGIPCLLVSDVHFRGKGFTVDVGSREEYFDLLHRYQRSDADPDRIRVAARRYAFCAFERYQVPLPFLDATVFAGYTSYAFDSTEELMADPTMQRIVMAIERRAPILAA